MAYYYLRTRPKAKTQQFTIDPEFAKKKRRCVRLSLHGGSVDGFYFYYLYSIEEYRRRNKG